VARRVAVLDWRDVQVLVAICSRPFARNELGFDKLDAARHQLIGAFHSYLQEWLPGKEIEDTTRIPLVAALEELSHLLPELEGRDQGQRPGDMTIGDVRNECLRISSLLRAAMADDGPSPGSFLTCLIMGPAVLHSMFGVLVA
jgi:hypothetical protein